MHVESFLIMIYINSDDEGNYEEDDGECCSSTSLVLKHAVGDGYP